jgi:3-hydroxy acid dehydrogenase/malonic semialdehyde reductase
MLNLKGSVVFVTGATAGIGRETALAFARLGTRVLVCGRREDRLDTLVGELREAGAEDAHGFALDVRSRSAVETALAELPEAWRAVRVLVNNAGLSRSLTKLYEEDPDEFDEMIDTNIKGLLFVTRALVPGMVERGVGHVINLGSTAGHMAYSGGTVYCATKAAERSISDGLRLDLLGTPVRVSSIDPGMVETEFSEVRFRGDTARAKKVYEGFTPLVAEDIADAIVWAATRPLHVSIQTVLLTSVHQANSLVTHRQPKP